MPLREELDKITRGGPPVIHHEHLLGELHARYPHSIRIVDGGALGLPPIEEYTCFMHALGIAGHHGYISLHDRARGFFFAGQDFMNFLLTSERLRPSDASRPAKDNIVVYFRDGQPEHAGIFRHRRVLSKWGQGHLYDHELYEVPASYGMPTPFHRLKSEQTVSAFHDFLIKNRVRLRGD